MERATPPIEIIDASDVLGSDGHIKPELMTVLSFGAEAKDAWEEHGEAVRTHLETCEQCRRELEEENVPLAS